MQFEGKHQINGIRIEIFKTNYYPSAEENVDLGWEGWGWSIHDANGKRTGLKSVFHTPDEAYEAAELELGN